MRDISRVLKPVLAGAGLLSLVPAASGAQPLVTGTPALGPAVSVVLRWTDWDWDPTIMAGLALAIAGYLSIARRYRARPRQVLAFWCGTAVLIVALLSPLHSGSGYLFTLHMVQHMLLLLVAPPLLAMAIPPAFLGRLYRQPAVARVLRFLWSPVTSLILFNGVLLIWHLPVMYDLTLRYRWVHALEHVSFVCAGMVFWGVIVSPAPKLVRASYGVRLALVMAADIVNFLLGFGLAFAGRPLYLPYVRAPRLWGLTPLDDLHLGGAVMWTMGQMMYAVPMLILLNVLLRREGAGGAQAGAFIDAADHGPEAPVNSPGPSVSSARP
jgi:putative membrane protein